MQRGVTVGQNPVWWGPARTFLGRLRGRVGSKASWWVRNVEGVTCEVSSRRRGGGRGLGGHSAQAVWPLAGLGSQSGPTEAHEQISLCDQNPRAPTHLPLQCPGAKGLLGRGHGPRERPSFLNSRGRVPKAPAHVWAPGALLPAGAGPATP